MKLLISVVCKCLLCLWCTIVLFVGYIVYLGWLQLYVALLPKSSCPLGTIKYILSYRFVCVKKCFSSCVQNGYRHGITYYIQYIHKRISTNFNNQPLIVGAARESLYWWNSALTMEHRVVLCVWAIYSLTLGLNMVNSVLSDTNQI